MLRPLSLRNKALSVSVCLSVCLSLFVLIISVCAIVAHICVCSIARTGC